MNLSAAQPQPGILLDVPPAARYLSFVARATTERSAWLPALQSLSGLVQEGLLVVGLGDALVRSLGAGVPGLRPFPSLAASVDLPRTPLDLWCWLRADAPGELVHRTRSVQSALDGLADCTEALGAFRHGRGPGGFGLDLSGYEDGIENPRGDAALAAAVVRGAGAGLDGGSFVALQRWRHDWQRLDAMDRAARDRAIGRRMEDSEELEDAPASAHVKRTAQEAFDPPAFVLRRSMPWAHGLDSGLMFVAFGSSLDAFEAQLRRMAGLDDGIVDALFSLSRPVSGSFAWCPPVRSGQLDLAALRA